MNTAVLGIDLGGTNCRGAVISTEGQVEQIHRIPTRIDEGLTSFFHRLVGFCRQILGEARDAGIAVSAIGMGAPGVIDYQGRITQSPNLHSLNGFPLAAELSSAMGMPVSLINDANAIAWGETLFGAGKGAASCLTMTLGTGVGGGLVLGGVLWEGSDGAAGEVGHIMVEPQGRPCGCGSRGCLEQYASASGIVVTVRELLSQGRESILREDGGILDSHTISLAARKGDAVALQAFVEAGKRLGQVIAGVVNLLNLDRVVITGGASESLDLMMPHLRRELELRAFDVPVRRLSVLRGTLGDDAGILGAARLAYDRHLHRP